MAKINLKEAETLRDVRRLASTWDYRTKAERAAEQSRRFRVKLVGWVRRDMFVVIAMEQLGIITEQDANDLLVEAFDRVSN